MSSSSISSAAASPICKRTAAPNKDTASNNKKPRTQTNHHHSFPALGAASLSSPPEKTIFQTEQNDYQSPPKSPSTPRPQYGTGPIVHPTEQNTTPGGSREFALDNGAHVRITTNQLGNGSETTAYSGLFTSPGKTQYAVAAIRTNDAPQTIYTHPQSFGYIATIQVIDDPWESEYIALTVKGTTLKDACEKIEDYDAPPKYKLAFLLHYFPTIVDKLILIQNSGHVHRDLNGQNLVITDKADAYPIDMRNIPLTGSRTQKYTPGYLSPRSHQKKQSETSGDVFALGKTISIGFSSVQNSFTEIPGLTELLADMEKPREERPSLDTVKDRLETCLQAFKASNADEYDAQLMDIHNFVFA